MVLRKDIKGTDSTASGSTEKLKLYARGLGPVQNLLNYIAV